MIEKETGKTFNSEL